MSPATLDVTGLRPWLDAVTAKYGHLLEAVLLVGSRSAGYQRPDSDWDVVLCLLDDVYSDCDAAVRAEQAIAFDASLPRPEQRLDLFIVRPDGELVRWERWPDEDVRDEPTGRFCGMWPIANGYVQGPTGDFSRFFREWGRDCPVIWASTEHASVSR